MEVRLCFIDFTSDRACWPATGMAHWLRNVAVNVYAEVDLEMKAKALANCEIEGKKKRTPWKEDKGLMEFLRKL